MKRIIVLIGMVFVFLACTGDFKEINTDHSIALQEKADKGKSEEGDGEIEPFLSCFLLVYIILLKVGTKLPLSLIHIFSQLLFLEAKDPDKDIQLYINSPGGSVTAGMAIYDTMQYIKCDVSRCV